MKMLIGFIMSSNIHFEFLFIPIKVFKNNCFWDSWPLGHFSYNYSSLLFFALKFFFNINKNKIIFFSSYIFLSTFHQKNYFQNLLFKIVKKINKQERLSMIKTCVNLNYNNKNDLRLD